MSIAEELQVRQFQFRAEVADDGHTISGIGVPFDTEIEVVRGFFERFEPGSVEDDSAILRYAHREPLGVITVGTDVADGRQITARISATTLGNDIATLVNDGALTSLSIGFYPIEYTDEERDDGTHRTYKRVHAVEYSVVEFPAYPTATITEVRNHQEETPMTTPVRAPEAAPPADLSALEAAFSRQLDEIDREMRSRFDELAAKTAAPATLSFRSFGEYAKALASPNDARHHEARDAFSGTVTSDATARPAWLGVLEKRMTAKQVVTNMFTHTMDLPAVGMSIEYTVKKGKSGVKVGKQAAQGDKLTTGKVADYEIKSAPVETYGGVGKLSIQAVERASVSLLDDLLTDQAYEYAKQIEDATRELFYQSVTDAEAAPLTTYANLDALTVDELISFAFALVDAYDETPYIMDGLACSGTVFEHIAKLKRDPKALQFTAAPTDHQGTLSVRDGQGRFAELLVQRIPNWSGTHFAAYSADAIRIKEAPGAPLRLQDTTLLDLSKDFAIYGYASHFAPHAELIKAVKFTA